MKKKNHTPQQIIEKLCTARGRLRAEGATVAEAARQIEVSEQTYYQGKTSLWRRKYAKMDQPQLKRLKEPREGERAAQKTRR